MKTSQRQISLFGETESTCLRGDFHALSFSVAGKRKGTDDERHLWPEMLRAIREIKPRWIVGENVFGLVNWDGGLVFEQVQADLEAQGYEVQPYILPAASVNAPHRRDRVWFVAHSKCNNDFGEVDGGNGKKESVEGIHRAENSAAGESCRTDIGDDCRHRSIEYVTYTSDTGLQGRAHIGSAGSGWTEWNEQPAGRVCPDWDEFPTQPPVCSGNDGLSAGLAGITVSKHRNESIKAYGNAIVPQVVYQIFKAIEQWEHSSH